MTPLQWLRQLFQRTDPPDIVIEPNRSMSSIQLDRTQAPSLDAETQRLEEPRLTLSSAPRRSRDPRRMEEEDWELLRRQIFERDNYQCQITGCINRDTNLECHHIESIATGGTNDEENLVTLCMFHHACQHADALTLMRDRADRRRFSIKPMHWRNGNQVRGHFSRVDGNLVTYNDLKQCRELYQPKCPECQSLNWVGFLRPRRRELVVLCPDCMKGMRVDLGVREETCVALTNYAPPRNNPRRLDSRSFDPSLVGLRIHPEPVRACKYCFGEDDPRKCGYLVPSPWNRRQLRCINYWNNRLQCPYNVWM